VSRTDIGIYKILARTPAIAETDPEKKGVLYTVMQDTTAELDSAFRTEKKEKCLYMHYAEVHPGSNTEGDEPATDHHNPNKISISKTNRKHIQK
jgi:hypothetical protein